MDLECRRALRVRGLMFPVAADGKIHKGATHGIRLTVNHDQERPGRPGRHHPTLLPFLDRPHVYAKIRRKLALTHFDSLADPRRVDLVRDVDNTGVVFPMTLIPPADRPCSRDVIHP